MYNVNVFKSNGTYLYIALKSSDISADSDCKIQFYKLTGTLFKNYSISLQNPWKNAISPM